MPKRQASTRRRSARQTASRELGSRRVVARQVSTHEPKVKTQLGRAAVRIFAVNERMNQLLIEHLDPEVWVARISIAKVSTAKPASQPPAATGRASTRSIAAIFTHMHNVRCKWIRLTAPHLKVPKQLDRAHCTPQQARAGLAESGARCAEMLGEALGDSEGRIKEFRRDGWARAWPVGPEMLCYMLAHEAHHRGQVCMLAHQLGFQLPNAVMSGIWNWEKLWKDIGSPAGPGGDS